MPKSKRAKSGAAAARGNARLPGALAPLFGRRPVPPGSLPDIPPPSPAVTLTKTKQDRRSLKRGLVETVQENVDKFARVYVFAFENMRTSV
jgi:hypothetical protein